MRVNFDAKTWARLATIADRQEVSIADLITAAAQRLTTGTSTVEGLTGRGGLPHTRQKHREALIREVVKLRGRGLTVVEIARTVGYSKSYVSRLLTENGHRSWTRTTNGRKNA